MAEPDLPYIDRHCVEVDARAEDVWEALGRWTSSGFTKRAARRYARLVGCEDASVNGPPLAEGSTFVGFHVAEAEPPHRVVAAGRHRFSRYTLTFEIGGGGATSSLCATTRASFPGPHGALYKALVIGSRGHVLGVRSILASIKRSAER